MATTASPRTERTAKAVRFSLRKKTQLKATMRHRVRLSAPFPHGVFWRWCAEAHPMTLACQKPQPHTRTSRVCRSAHSRRPAMHRSAARSLPRHTLAAAVLCALALAGCHRTTTIDETHATAEVGSQRDQAAPAANEESLESIVITDSEARRVRQEAEKTSPKPTTSKPLFNNFPSCFSQQSFKPPRSRFF